MKSLLQTNALALDSEARMLVMNLTRALIQWRIVNKAMCGRVKCC